MDHPLTAYRKHRGWTFAEMGAFLGANKASVFKWEHRLGPSPSRAIEIERLTDGKVSRWELRPDLWSAPLPAFLKHGEAE